MVPSRARRRSRGSWEMAMTVAGRKCQSWCNTMAKGRIVSCRAPWKMKNAPPLHLELMDGVSEIEKERGKIERKTLRPLWRGIILAACLFICSCRCGSAYARRKNPGSGKTKVSPFVYPEAGGRFQHIWPLKNASQITFRGGIIHNPNTFGLTLSLWNTR